MILNQLKLKKGTFFGDTFTLVSGTVVAQLVTVAITPILTRYYSPEVFGVTALFLSVTGVISIIAGFRYELAIVLPKDDHDAAALLFAATFFSLVIGGLTVAILVVLQVTNIQLGSYEPVVKRYWLVGFAVTSGGLLSIYNYWCTRKRYYLYLSINKIIVALLTSSILVLFGALGHRTATVKISAPVFSRAAGACLLLFIFLKRDARPTFKNTSLNNILANLKRYRKFPLINIWSSLLNTISWQLPAIILISFFNAEIVGYYALAFSVLKQPMSFVGRAVSQVYFQRAAKAYIDGNLRSVVEPVFKKLIWIGLFPFLMLSLVGRDIAVVVFGQNWAEAGIYLQYLSLWTFFWFVASPVSNLYNVLEKQEELFWFNVLLFVSRLIAIGAGGLLNNPRLSIGLFSGSGILTYGLLSVVVMKKAGIPLSAMLRTLAWCLVVFIPAGLVLIIMSLLWWSSVTLTIVAAVFLVLYYILVVAGQKGKGLLKWMKREM